MCKLIYFAACNKHARPAAVEANKMPLNNKGITGQKFSIFQPIYFNNEKKPV